MKRDALPASVMGASAWSLRFDGTAGSAEWQPVGIEAAFASEQADTPTVVFLPSGAATPYEVQRQAEGWALAADTGQLRLDLLFRGDRVIWTAERIVVVGAADRFHEVAVAVERFTWLERELRSIEAAAREGLDSAEQDVGLTHAVTTRDLGESRRVGARTHAAHRNRIRITRLEARLVQPGSALTGAARRLLSEMTLLAEFTDRLRAADEQIEVAQDVYDTVNDRLTEFSHFVREYRVEVVIVLMLALEAALIIWDMVAHSAA